MDSPTDTHRHLSHLIGLYPGYALSSYDSSAQSLPKGQKAYTQAQVLNATKTSLIHRGNGTGPDADSGWEKVWRAAAWAQFGNASEFYHELTVRSASTRFVYAPKLTFLFSMPWRGTLARICSVYTTPATQTRFSRSTPTSDSPQLSL